MAPVATSALTTRSRPRDHVKKKDQLCCVSGVFDKQGSIKVLLSLHCSLTHMHTRF